MGKFYSLVAPIVHEAGEDLAKYFGKVDSIAQKTASPVDIVTELDVKTEELIASRLKEVYPSIEFFGEELGGNDKAERFWLLDPIDGTAHFMRGIPFCTTMLALIEDGQVVFSLIYNFVTKDMYFAERGGGSKLNGTPIHVSSRPLKDAYISVEANHHKNENLNKFILIRKKCPIITTMSAGFEYGLIATGKIEARVCFDPYGKDWDYAPGSLLVSEAGGIVKNIGSDSYDYRNHNFIAGNKSVYEELKGLF
ncbi:MAG: inositol monophosphatase [bacterium]|nr:inositol monophosphatase [bacterium]